MSTPEEPQPTTPTPTPRYAPPVSPDSATPVTPEQPQTPMYAPDPADAPASTPTPQSPGRALAITAMAIGLVALLTAVVAAFYFASFLFGAFVLGAAAVIFTIVALVKRQRPLAPSIIGGVTGALSMVVALFVGVMLLVSMVGVALPWALSNGVGAATSGGADAGGSDSGSPHSAPDEITDAASLAWPANMASGGIRFVGDDGAVTLVSSDALPDNAFPETARGDGDPANLIQLYVDYRCPYCAQFEQTNAETLESVLTDSDTEVALHALTFLDRASDGSYYSSRAAGAMACIADAQPDVAWAAHQRLLSPDFQPAEGIAGHDAQAMISALDQATGGLDDEIRTCILADQFVPFAQALNSWVFDTTVPGAVDPNLTVTGTPFVVVNGVPYAGPLDDTAAFTTFLVEQGITLD